MTVIGAGIVGVCCALHLQREGFKVRLVEKGEPGMKTSFGNSGSFGTASCVPFALPGVLKKVPKMLFDSESPLKLRWSHVPKALPFFLRLLSASRPSRVEAIAAARNSLLVHTHAGYAPLIEGADAAQWVDHNGLMMVFESDAAFESALETWLPEARARRDFLYGYRQRIEDLDLAEIRRLPGWFAGASRRARQARRRKR